MPPKQSKKDAEEIKELQKLITDVWEDYSVPQDFLRNPTPEFTNNFFSKCLNELETCCTSMFTGIHEQRLGDLMSYCPASMDRELFLYVYVKHVMELINIKYITATDFYKPPKRTKTSMKIFLSFLLFVKEAVLNGQKIIEKQNMLVNLYNNSRERERQMQAEIANIDRKSGETSEEIENLEKELEELSNSKEVSDQEYAKELADIEKKERETALLEIQLKELEEQVKSISATNAELEAKMISKEEYDTQAESLERLKRESSSLDEQEEQRETNFKEKRNNISHLQKLRAILESANATVWDHIQEVDDEEAAIDTITPINTAYQKNINNLKEKSKKLETDIKELNEQTKYEEKLMERTQKDCQAKSIKIQKKCEVELKSQQHLKDEAKLIQENIKRSKLKCKETEKDIEQVIEINSNMYQNVLASYQEITSVVEKNVEITCKK